MDKNSKDKIKKLKSEQKYDEIFAEFGSKQYVRNTPRKIKRAELKKFKQERRYEDIFNKYGENEYSKYLAKAMYEEIKEIGGLRKAFLWKLKKIVLRGSVDSLAFLMSISIGLPISNQKLVHENAIAYADEIKNYNEKIDKYASHINSMNLSDIQIFMKVMDDMWKNIKGYKEPEKDIHGFLELDLASEDGYGVCRNMASDVARKLQEINPDYNARTITVYMDEGYKVADIERTVVQDNETVMESSGEEQTQNSSNFNITKITGNHMVTLVDLKDENLTLVLDPTNPGIGIYKDGNIFMLNTAKENLVQYDTKEIITTLCFRTGIDAGLISLKDFFSSFENSSMSLDEIIEKYGLEAQNKALTEVRALEAADLEVRSLESNREENDFEKRIKVDISQLNNKDEKQVAENKNIEQKIENERDD